MAVTFTRAPEVAAGDPITSAQMIKLAEAFNDRIRSGIADPTFRIQQLSLNSFRRPIAPESFSFAPIAAFHEFYSHLKPSGGVTWPDGTAGDANLACQMMAFVRGNPSLEAENVRLKKISLAGVPGTSKAARWNLGKQQRGVVDPTTGASYATAFITAQEHFKIVQPPLSNHGKSYGGFQPTPLSNGPCGDSYGSEDYQYFFTSIVGSPDVSGVTFGSYADGKVSYSCSCTNGGSNCVDTIIRTPFAYYIKSNGGSIDRLPISDFLEGPYTGGGVLRKQDGHQLTHFLQAFLQDFRGLDIPIETIEEDVQETGFDFQTFLTSQYFLSPNVGHVDGSELVADYPSFSFSGSATIASGTATSEHTLTAGFVAAVAFAEASELSAPVDIEMLENGARVGVIHLDPTKPEEIITIRTPVSGATIKFRLMTDAAFETSGGSITIETTEQTAYKPHLHDAYLVLRMMATGGDTLDDLDGSGTQIADSKVFSDRYFEDGYIHNPTASEPAPYEISVNDNPVFDAARRLVESMVRIVRPEELLSYEVSCGKSILRFKRHAYGNTLSDQFADFGPSAEDIEDGDVREGVVYVLRSGTATYNGSSYSEGDTFTGAAGVDFFDEKTGVVREHEGIRPDAPPGQFSREWVMHTSEKIYSESESTFFDPDEYSRQFPIVNRCVNFPFNGNNTQAIRHYHEGISPIIAPEAPSGYNYALDIHAFGISEEFYKSCRIYEPDSEIESVTSAVEGGIEVVTLTFKTRLHHWDGAPATIDRNPANWTDDLEAEPYRTRENSIRQYLKHNTGTPCSIKAGDSADGAQPSNTRGACWPHFFFTRLVPKPYEDGNNTLQKTDTLLVARTFAIAAFYLRAMCEGYVDGTATEAYACFQTGSNLYDYTYENLCFDAFGGRTLTSLPESQRPDKPEGTGPLVNTVTYADIFNQFSKALNKLTKARLELPFKFQTKTTNYEGTGSETPGWGSGGACTPVFTAAKIGASAPSPSNIVSQTEWDDSDLVVSDSFAGFDPDDPCVNPTTYNTKATKRVEEYRFQLVDPNAIHAIPEAWRDAFLTGNGIGFLGIRNGYINVASLTEVGTSGESADCGGTANMFWNSPTGYADNAQITYPWGELGTCTLFTSAGTADCGDADSGDYMIGANGSGQVCNFASARQLLIEPRGNRTQFINIALVD